MNALIRKEIRLILPAWIAAMILSIAPVWFVSARYLVSLREEGAVNASLAFGIGAIFLGLAPFGQECGFGTFSLLLAQPVTRRRIWRVKIIVVAVAMILAMTALLLSYQIRTHLSSSIEILVLMLKVGSFSALAAFAGGLWTTLIFRQVGAAFWFTLLVPLAILMAAAQALEKSSLNSIEAGLSAVLVLYAIAGFLWARRMFFRAQDVQWTGGTVTLPAWLSFSASKESVACVPKRMPFRPLIRKEFQSHHVSLLIGAGLLLLHLVVVGIRRMDFDPTQSNNVLSSLLELWWVLWFGLPFLVGSTAVAEERKLGTLESQLCLPTTRRAQFVVKLVIALTVGVFLGGVMPWVAESIGGFAIMRGSSRGAGSERFLSWHLALTCAGAGWITLVSFYASTLTRNLLQAMGTSVAAVCALTVVLTWAIEGTVNHYHPSPWGIPLIGYIGLPVILAALGWLAFKNYQHVLVGWNIWIRNLLAISISMTFAFTASAALYWRSWELLMTLEPRHGPAQLSGAIRPKICSVSGNKLFALLPDGRLWAAAQFESKEFDEYEEINSGNKKTVRLRKVRFPVPMGGVLLGFSNWVGLANSDSQVVGIQSDGSLWKVFSQDRTVPWNDPANLSVIPRPERIGSDANWKSVAAGNGRFLALKKNGTLWGWGNNQDKISPGGKEFTNGPVRISAESDWDAAFVSFNSFIGIKSDGSVWKWGWVHRGPNGWGLWKGGPLPDPVRWNLADGTDWLVLTGEPRFNLVLRQNGTLWVAGNFPQNLFDLHFDREVPHDFSRIGQDTDWADLAGSSQSLVAIKNDGTLIQNDVDASSILWSGNVREPSKYSDWIAVGVAGWKQAAALAADGTVSVWGEPYGARRLVGPTRKPLWSINILAQSNSSRNTETDRAAESDGDRTN